MKALVFGASLRTGSFNKQLAKLAAGLLRDAGVTVDEMDMREIDMPLYDGDVEFNAGLPKGALHFRERIAQSDAIFIASPEYNHGVPGILKNAIDWASRPPQPQPFRGKVVALGSASAGAFAGIRGLMALRPTLRVLGCLVIPNEVSIPNGGSAFEPNGALKDAHQQKLLAGVVAELVRVTTALASAAAPAAR